MEPLRGSHVRLYRGLIRLYPTGFRARFGDEMVQLFGDQLRDARARRGSIAIGGVWLRTIGDLIVTASSEHAREDGTMAHSLTIAPSRATRVVGLAGILSGAWLVAWLLPFVPWGPEGVNLRLIAFNVGAIAIVVTLARRLPASARLTAAIATIAVIANAWHLLLVIFGIDRPVPPQPDPDFRLIGFWAGVAMWWADAAFGVVSLHFGGIARWGGLALVVGSVLAFLGMDRLEFVAGPYRDLVVPLALAGITLNGVGWILLGIDVATRRRPVPAA